MRKLRPYKGVVTDDPKQMKTASLKAYVKHCEEYLEWCLDADGRVNSYDRMSTRMEPYVLELEARSVSSKKT